VLITNLFFHIATRYNKTNTDWRYRSLLEIVSPKLEYIALCLRQQAIFSRLRGNTFQ